MAAPLELARERRDGGGSLQYLSPCDAYSYAVWYTLFYSRIIISRHTHIILLLSTPDKESFFD
jgi:hypothetical protein